MFQKVLVAVDGSATSTLVLNKAISLVKDTESCLSLLSVIQPFAGAYPTPIYLGMDSFNAIMTTEAYNGYLTDCHAAEKARLSWLKSQANRIQQLGIQTEYKELTGDPGHCICDVAKQWPADLIVIGRRGLSGLSELLLGSVSNYVMHHAPCSVLTVQGQQAFSSDYAEAKPIKAQV